MLRRTYRNENIRVDVTTQLFDNFVLPILTYLSEVWYPYTEQSKGGPIGQPFKSSTGYHQSHENVHIEFCRQILGIHNKAMRIPVLAELGRLPVSLKIVSKVIAFWAHIVTSDVDSYTRKINTDMTEHLGLGMTHVWDRLKRAVLVKLQD